MNSVKKPNFSLELEKRPKTSAVQLRFLLNKARPI